MRIEILLGNSEEPLIFPLNKPKLTLGSGETCDILVDAPNISRKHVQIVCEGDNFYVIDQGSTNGTFINEERLVPGRRTEFTSFFPVRLGDEVLITLLSDEEVTDDSPPLSFPEVSRTTRSSDESTQMISLGDLRKAKTADLVVRRTEIAKKKNAPAGKGDKKKSASKTKRAADKSRMRNIQIVVFLLLGGAAYVNFFMIEKGEDKAAKMGEVISTDTPVVKEEKPVYVPPPTFLIPEEELTPKERLANLFADIKCTLDTEKYFCNTIPKANEGQFGAVQIGAMMNVIVDGEFFIQEAKRIYPMPAPAGLDGQHTAEEITQYNTSINEIAGAIFLLRSVPTSVDYELIKDFKMTFALFTKDPEGNPVPGVAIAISPGGLKEFKRVFEEVHLVNVSKIGPSAIGFTKPLFRAY